MDTRRGLEPCLFRGYPPPYTQLREGFALNHTCVLMWLRRAILGGLTATRSVTVVGPDS